MHKIDLCFDEFVVDCKLRGLSGNTIKTYEKCWIHFIKQMEIDELSELSKTTVKRYTMQLMERDLSNHTVNNYLRHLRAILNWMADEEQEFIPPVKVKMVKATTQVKDVFTEKQLHFILKKPTKADRFITWRCWFIASVLSHTGMRGATLLRVRWCDIDLKIKTMHLHHTKNNARVIPLSDELVKVLLIYKRMFNPKPSQPLISSTTGEPISTRTMQQTMKTYHKKRGIENNSMHQYRRTFITNALARGVDSIKIARIVGHSDLQMINKHYLAHNVEFLRDVVEDKNKRL